MRSVEWGRGGAAVLAIAAAILSTTAAQAAVTISSLPTQNMTCTNGICAPTAKSAVLNVGDLETGLASGNLTVTTTGAGVEADNIDVKSALSWATASALSLSAHRSVAIDKRVSVTGAGGLAIETGTNGTLSFDKAGHVTFANISNKLSINGNAYKLANSLRFLAYLMTWHPSDNIALTRNYDAGADGTYPSTPIRYSFQGIFEGLGNTISNVTINIKDHGGTDGIGLFSTIMGTVRDFGLVNINITVDKFAGRNGALMGGLAGTNYGTISQSHATGALDAAPVNFGGLSIGGLIGFNVGTIDQSFAGANVETNGGSSTGFVGGLVGQNFGLIAQSYATGMVVGGITGGLVGGNGSTIADSYSTGAVQGGEAGGLIGKDDAQSGSLTDSYWDTTTSGITNLSQGAGNIPNDPGITGLTTTQLQSGLPQGFEPSIWAEKANINGGLPYLLANPPAIE